MTGEAPIASFVSLTRLATYVLFRSSPGAVSVVGGDVKGSLLANLHLGDPFVPT